MPSQALQIIFEMQSQKEQPKKSCKQNMFFQLQNMFNILKPCYAVHLHHHDARSYHKGTACGLLMAGSFLDFSRPQSSLFFTWSQGVRGLKYLGNGQLDDQHSRPYYTVVDWV
jgi:hypothetical protein